MINSWLREYLSQIPDVRSFFYLLNVQISYLDFLIYYCLTNNWFEVAWNHSGLTTFLYGYQFEIFFVQTCTQSSHVVEELAVYTLVVK